MDKLFVTKIIHISSQGKKAQRKWKSLRARNKVNERTSKTKIRKQRYEYNK